MPTPPIRAKNDPFTITRHGDARDDPYYWLMDREKTRTVLAHLRAENDFLAESFSELEGPLKDELFEEIKSRIAEETVISSVYRSEKERGGTTSEPARVSTIRSVAVCR